MEVILGKPDYQSHIEEAYRQLDATCPIGIAADWLADHGYDAAERVMRELPQTSTLGGVKSLLFAALHFDNMKIVTLDGMLGGAWNDFAEQMARSRVFPPHLLDGGPSLNYSSAFAMRPV